MKCTGDDPSDETLGALADSQNEVFRTLHHTYKVKNMQW